jgi:hypothetical protein
MQGEPIAIYNIGQMHTIGAEVQQSKIMAFAHYKIANSMENTLSDLINKRFNTLKSQMTQVEIQAGEQESRKLMREYGIEN